MNLHLSPTYCLALRYITFPTELGSANGIFMPLLEKSIIYYYVVNQILYNYISMIQVNYKQSKTVLFT